MKPIRLLFLLCLFLIPMMLPGQFLEGSNIPRWEKRMGGKGNDAFHAVIRNFNGDLALAGVNEDGSKNLFFAIIDLQGKIIMERNFDLGGDEVATCLAQTRDNGYLIAGHSTSSKGRRAFVTKLSAVGEIVNTYFFDPPSAIFDLATKDYTRFWLTGESNEKLLLAHFNDAGLLLWQETYQNNYRQTGRSIQQLPQGQLLIAANTTMSKSKRQVSLLTTDWNGKPIHASSLEGQLSITSVNDMVVATGGNLLLVGTARSHPKGMNNNWIALTDSTGILLGQTTTGDIGNDEIHAISPGFKNEYHITGLTQSLPAGHSRRSKMWLQSITDDLSFIRDDRDTCFFGGNQDDAGLDLLPTHDGSLIVAGYSASGKADKKDAWIKKIPLFEKLTPRAATISTTAPRLLDENDNGSLDRGEHTRLTFTVRNTSSEDIIRLKAHLSGNVVGIGYPPQVPLDFLEAGKEKKVIIPLEGTPEIANGKQFLNIAFSAENELEAAVIQVPVRTQKEVSPDLEFGGHAFVKTSQPNAGHFFFLNLKNTGSLSAKEVDIAFTLPPGSTALSDNRINIPRIDPQSSEMVFLEYRADVSEAAEQIQCRIVYKNTEQQLDTTFTYHTLIGGSSSLQANNSSSEERFVWLNPKPLPSAIIQRYDTVFTADLSAKVVFISPRPLRNREINLTVHQPGMEGSKIRRRSGTHRVYSVERNGLYLHFLHADLTIHPHQNTLSMVVNRKGLPQLREEFSVYYQQPKPNLYLLSIGVPHNDLKYTTHDAADFAEAIARQEGFLYDSVHIQLLNRPDNTTTPHINKAVKDLVDLQTTNLLRPFDVIMVFISSHGFRQEHSTREYAFKIETQQSEGVSFYDPIDFEVDVLEPLAQIDCQRFTFVDACHSGSNVDGDKSTIDFRISQTLSDLIKAQPDLYSIMSCGPNELSWEDSTWQNGAFTKTLLEVFENTEQEVGTSKIRANTDGDNASITIKEMHAYLSQRVPYLIEKVICPNKPNLPYDVPCTQKPYMPQKQAKLDLPFIYISKNQQ